MPFVIITDILKKPIDEGAKVATFNITEILTKKYNCSIFSVNCDNHESMSYQFNLNKLLFSFSFYNSIKNCPFDNILYIPEASITLFTFIRAKLLKIFTQKKNIYIISFQPRKYNSLAKKIIRIIQPSLIVTQSTTNAHYLSKIGINRVIIPLGVDFSKFYEMPIEYKKQLRLKYSIPYDKTVLLHVGHIQSSRNLNMLIQIKAILPEIEIIVAGSTYSPNDKHVESSLTNAGVIILNQYISDIEELYNISDFYIFPVLETDGAIQTPLSILEAMACNLPIITTRFGSLPDIFQESDCFHFVTSADDAVHVIKDGKPFQCSNRSKLKPFTWDSIVKKIVSIVDNA